MRLSDDKINHLSHVLLACLKDYDDVEFHDEENQIRLSIKESVIESLQTLEKIEEKVNSSLSSYSRKIVEGSREWDIMYSKAYDEEIEKLRGV